MALGREIIQTVDRCAWYLGDLALHVDTTYGGKELESWAEGVEIEYEAAKKYRYVSRQYQKGKRFPDLKFGHHMVVAAREDRYELLTIAAKEGWSVARLRLHVQELEAREGKRAFPWLCYTDIWNIPLADDGFGTDYPGRIPGRIVQNTLYYFTAREDLVIDPMAGGGVTVDVCKAMERRCVAFDIAPPVKRKDVAVADALEPWPVAERAGLVFIDPPYWRQQRDRYGGIAQAPTHEEFMRDLLRILQRAWDHTRPAGRLAVLLAPTAIQTAYRDSPVELVVGAAALGWRLIRRICVPVSSQQVGPQVMAACKEDRILVALLRDLVVFEKGDPQ